MKWIFLLSLAFMVSVIDCKIDLHGKRVQAVANFLQMTKEDVQECMSEYNITIYDADYVITNDYSRVKQFDDKTLKIGCFFACLAEKKELIPITDSNVENIKETIRGMFRAGYSTYKNTSLDLSDKAVNICVLKVRNEADNCTMTLKFIQCYKAEGIIRIEETFNILPEKIANFLLMPEEDIYTCMNKSSIIVDDYDDANEIVQLKNMAYTREFDDRTWKLACFFGCLGEKKGLLPITDNTDAENVKEIIRGIVRANKVYKKRELPLYDLVIDSCVDLVKIGPESCRIGFAFVQCYIYEANSYVVKDLITASFPVTSIFFYGDFGKQDIKDLILKLL